MDVYLLILFGLAISALIPSILPRARRSASARWMALIAGTLMASIVGVRASTVGTDVETYLGHYSALRLGVNTSPYEPGFVALGKAIAWTGASPQIYLAVLGCLTVLPVAWLCARFSPQPVFSLALFVLMGHYGFMFSGLRQSLAMAVVVLSYPALRDRRPVLFVGLVAAATTFHLSAVVFVIAYPLWRFRMCGTVLVLALMSTVTLFLYRRPVYELVQSRFFPEYSLSESSSYALLIFNAAIFAAVFALSSHSGTEDDEVRSLLTVFAIGTCVLVFASVGTNAARMAQYFLIFGILLVPRVLSTLTPHLRHVSTAATVLVLFPAYLYITVNGELGLIPYVFFWEE